MPNGPSRAEFWKAFICERCPFPSRERVQAQFDVAVLSDFCECGCNSFALKIPAEASTPPFAHPGNKRAFVYEADFRLDGLPDTTVEILIFADERGHISYVEIDCCGNSKQMPERIEVSAAPYHVHTSTALIP